MNLTELGGWVARKLASQDSLYLPRRLSYSVRKAWTDRRFPSPSMAHRAALALPSWPRSITEHFTSRPSPRWHFDRGSIGSIVEQVPATRARATIDRANQVARGRFSFGGHAPEVLVPIDWNHAPKGDPSWTRCLNRHAYFETLGFAYHYTQEPCFLDTFVQLSSNWIEHNGLRVGQQWWDDPFEVAYRINSWIWSFFLFVEDEDWEEDYKASFLETIGLMTEYLYNTIEYHSPGNHILLEAKTLVLCAETFPEFCGAGKWREKAWPILLREVDKQIGWDGVHVERATQYQRVIAGELAELWSFCRRNHLMQAERLESDVRRMAEFQKWLELGGGRYPLFGDSRAEDSYFRFSAPVLVDRILTGSATEGEVGISDHSWWVSVAGNRARILRETNARVGARAFHPGGYFVSRRGAEGGKNVLVWDCGPFGYDANRKHAHADALSFVLSIGGEPLLIDPGVGGPWYFARNRISEEMSETVRHWRTLRSTRAHNTICVDREDQARLAARNEIWDPPVPVVKLWAQSSMHDVMWGEHDGYCRLKDGVRHQRVILVGHDGYWLVLDQLTGAGIHLIESRYHVAPGAAIARIEDRRFSIMKESAHLVVEDFASSSIEDRMRMDVEERWGEMGGGAPQRIQALRASVRGEVPMILGSVLTLPQAHWGLREVRVTSDQCDIVVGSPLHEDHISVRMDSSSHQEYGISEAISIDRYLGTELIGHWTMSPEESHRTDRRVLLQDTANGA